MGKKWYPTEDRVQVPTAKKSPAPRTDLKAGQVVVLLSGKFGGRRVVYLKNLSNGGLLVTGPFKLNGVPLLRVKQNEILPTSTFLNLGNLEVNVQDKYFKRPKVKGEAENVLESKPSKQIPEERKEMQKQVDDQVVNALGKDKLLNRYLRTPFILRKGQFPHLLKF